MGRISTFKNPVSPSDTTYFCIEKVTLNGQEISFANSSAFEIDLAGAGIKQGDPVNINIYHEVGCNPKVLNTNIIMHSTFEIISIDVSSLGRLTWSTKNEKNKLTYTIEQYKWHKWVNVGEVYGIGSPDKNDYEFEVIPHSGQNKVRVTQTDYTGKKRPSQEVTFISTITEVEININQESKQILFSDLTHYELYDINGNMIAKDAGKMIDCSDLKNGTYFLNFDNQNSKVVFKK